MILCNESRSLKWFSLKLTMRTDGPDEYKAQLPIPQQLRGPQRRGESWQPGNVYCFGKRVGQDGISLSLFPKGKYSPNRLGVTYQSCPLPLSTLKTGNG